jgi:hypothetical protein
MSDYSTKNYTEQGGERTVIGGELVIAPGGKLTDNSGVAQDEAETPKIPYLANSTQSTAADVVKDFNALLTLLRAGGLMDSIAPTLTIITQPVDKNVAVNGSAELTVAGSCSDGRTVAYQWYSNTVNSATGGTKITTAGTATTYSAPTTTAETIYYYCVVSDGVGSATESAVPVTSSIVAVVVA